MHPLYAPTTCSHYILTTCTYCILLLSHQTDPALTLLERYNALSRSLVNTEAAKPYSVLFALSINSSRFLNFNICITGPKIWVKAKWKEMFMVYLKTVNMVGNEEKGFSTQFSVHMFIFLGYRGQMCVFMQIASTVNKFSFLSWVLPYFIQLLTLTHPHFWLVNCFQQSDWGIIPFTILPTKRLMCVMAKQQRMPALTCIKYLQIWSKITMI